MNIIPKLLWLPFLSVHLVGTALETYDPVAVLAELLRYRADPIAADRDGHSPLHHAASGNSHLAEEMALRLMQIPRTKEVRDLWSYKSWAAITFQLQF